MPVADAVALAAGGSRSIDVLANDADPDAGDSLSLTALSSPARGTARIALEQDGRLMAALFVAPTPVAIMRDHLSSLPGQAAGHVLTGRAPADLPDPGPVLCACFGVGINTLITAIESRGLLSVEAVGAALQAGSNCGSCRPEIAALLAAAQMREAAE